MDRAPFWERGGEERKAEDICSGNGSEKSSFSQEVNKRIDYTETNKRELLNASGWTMRKGGEKERTVGGGRLRKK